MHREVLRTQGRVVSRYGYDALGRKSAQWTQSAMLRVGSQWQPEQGPQQQAAWDRRIAQPALTDTLLKRWQYNAAGELARSQHSRNGQTDYRYDPSGRILATVQSLLPGGANTGVNTAAHSGTASGSTPAEFNEVFHFDPAGNRISQLEQQSSRCVANNRVKVLQDKRFDYDGFGRLIRKRIGNSQGQHHSEQHFRYDHQHRLTQVAVVRASSDGQPTSQVFSYRYDALGRRIAKQDAFGQTQFTWEGLRLLQEQRGEQLSTYVYESGSYNPLARIDGAGGIQTHPAAAQAFGHADPQQGKVQSIPTTNARWEDAFHAVAGPIGVVAQFDARQRAKQQQEQQLAAEAANDRVDAAADESGSPPQGGTPASRTSAQIYYFHTQANGLPEELTDTGGNIVWRAQYKTWGSTVQEEWQAFDDIGKPDGGMRSANPP